jgi:hypothetical protein
LVSWYTPPFGIDDIEMIILIDEIENSYMKRNKIYFKQMDLTGERLPGL